MNKIWVSVILLGIIVAGGFGYNAYINRKTGKMLSLAEQAIEAVDKGERGTEYIEQIDVQLEGISGFLCAFLDRDIINEAEESIVYAREMSEAGSFETVCAIEMVKEKIMHIKNSAAIELKYILFRGEVRVYVA